jgi:hypothetical protein
MALTRLNERIAQLESDLLEKDIQELKNAEAKLQFNGKCEYVFFILSFKYSFLHLKIFYEILKFFHTYLTGKNRL